MKNIALVGLGIAAIVVALVAYAFLKPTAEATAPIQAIPIAIATPSEEPAAALPSATTEGSVAVAATATEPAVAEADSSPVAEATEALAEAPTEAPAAQPTVFEIDQSASQARFVIDEVLRGSPVTVVGATDQVAGQIAVDPTTPAATQLGTIQINARTLVTDDDRRNQAVRNRILMTDQYEYITFTPTSLVGLPDSVTPGESFSFQAIGELTIRDQSRETTWDITVNPLSATQLEGTATTTIAYADWGLAIPSVPFVASVGQQVGLELDFIALSQ